MIEEYDRVTIKNEKTDGVVVDIRNVNGKPRYLVETDETSELVDCAESDLEKVNGS